MAGRGGIKRMKGGKGEISGERKRGRVYDTVMDCQIGRNGWGRSHAWRLGGVHGLCLLTSSFLQLLLVLLKACPVILWFRKASLYRFN